MVSQDKGRIIVYAENDLIKRVKMRAVIENRRISDMVKQIIIDYLDECEKNEK